MSDSSEEKTIVQNIHPEAQEGNHSEQAIEIQQEQFPQQLPILPLRNAVVFPQAALPLSVGRKSSLLAIDAATSGDRLIGALTQQDGTIDKPQPDDLYQVGTICRVLRMIKYPNGTALLIVQGVSRFQVTGVAQQQPYLIVNLQPLESELEYDIELEALTKQVSTQFQRVTQLVPAQAGALQLALSSFEDPGQLADFIAHHLDLDSEDKQYILETLNVKERLMLLLRFLEEQTEILELGSKIHTQVKGEIEKGMRERYLREQLSAIRHELGEEDNPEIIELRQRLLRVKMPAKVEKDALRELERLSEIYPGSAEYTVARTYLEWLIELPWSKSTRDKLDLDRAERILNEDHFDLVKIKERLMEYLAVLQLKKDLKSPILCLVGPPGVGKTSLGQSIARALGRKFVRISLGGMRDEAEIRGHRRTYIGALPGRIIQGLKRVGANNPVFMLDEIDKLRSDFMGDPAAALLEVLDPEQNNSFEDHYIDQPFDLSRVLFIATANITSPIPPALLDRVELLELPGYSEEEKLQIAKRYLVPRQIKGHGLRRNQARFEEEALLKVIREYTREAGVRNLEREIATVCRKQATALVRGKGKRLARQITPAQVVAWLGPRRYFRELAERTEPSGVAIGLAWTPVGGEIIFVEATRMRGKGHLLLTGQLGDVMKESAQTALSYLRSQAERLDLDPGSFERWDIHIHVPAGAIPKDGPSAGVTIAIALASLWSDAPVLPELAMTGEITLRGVVLPVGGIREKVLAAHRAGIKTIILPRHNEGDLEEVAATIKADLQFKLVDNISEVLRLALPERQLAAQSSIRKSPSSRRPKKSGSGQRRSRRRG
ncbi:MAG TPA: endopeptidase La [Candidatus Fraserbacteria bacterium]|nr:endopeptidase La [Candidatus Fraserbacteria bacterium]